MKIPMFGKLTPEYKCLERLNQNYNVWTDNARIPVFGRIRSEFQCLEGQG